MIKVLSNTSDVLNKLEMSKVKRNSDESIESIRSSSENEEICDDEICTIEDTEEDKSIENSAFHKRISFPKGVKEFIESETREILLSGEVTKLIIDEKKIKENHVFLTNDLLLYTKKKIKNDFSYQFIDYEPLEELLVEPIGRKGKNWKLNFINSKTRKNSSLSFPNEEQYQTWLAVISEALLALQNTRLASTNEELANTDLLLPLAVSNSINPYDNPKLGKALFRQLISKDLFLNFLIETSQLEIQSTKNGSVLFRENIPASFYFHEFFKLNPSLISQLLQHLINKSQEDEDEELDEATEVLRKIVEAVDSFPQTWKYLLKQVSSFVKQKFGEKYAKDSMETLLLLRFVCPALVMPRKYGIKIEMDSQMKDRILFIVKQMRHAQIEDDMNTENTEIELLFDDLWKKIDSFEFTEIPSLEIKPSYSEDSNAQDIKAIQRYCFDNKTKIGKQISQDQKLISKASRLVDYFSKLEVPIFTNINSPVFKKFLPSKTDFKLSNSALPSDDLKYKSQSYIQPKNLKTSLEIKRSVSDPLVKKRGYSADSVLLQKKETSLSLNGQVQKNLEFLARRRVTLRISENHSEILTKQEDLSNLTPDQLLTKKIEDYSFVTVLIFKGYCALCQNYVKKWVNSFSEITQGGGTIIAVTSDSQKAVNKYEHKWDLPFPILSDPKNEIATRLGTHISSNKSYPNGVAQPALVVLKKKELIYYWNWTPSLRNLGGLFDRPKKKEVFEHIRSYAQLSL